MALDVVLTVPQSAELDGWLAFDEVYVPGRGRPQQTAIGQRCWLRHHGGFVAVTEILDIVHRPSRPTRLTPGDRGPGWSLLVGGWQEVDLTDADMAYDPGPASRGLRYLHAASGGPRTGVRFRPPATISPEPVEAHSPSTVSTWNRVEAELVADWIAWREADGASVVLPEITTGEGAVLVADAFDEARALLVEAKGTAGREHVRMAIGQVLDYSALLPDEHRCAVLLPERPVPSLVSLLHGLGIGLIHRTDDGFREALP